MLKINVITSDECVWNLEEVLVSIARAGSSPILLNLLSEGPCCQTSGIDNLLDRVSLDPDVVLIQTSNQIPSSRYPEKRQRFVELDMARHLASNSTQVSSTMHYLFGLFVGRSNWQRLGLAAHLHTYHKDCSRITFHYDPNSAYHKDNFGLEKYLQHSCKDNSVWNFIEHLPIKSDNITYPILWNQGAFDLTAQYRDIFCEIVCETYFTGRTFFVTEKTWRPIINLRPFIIQGPQWYLYNLRKLGFCTFSQWWDEGYDQDHSDARLGTLQSNIDWIASQPRSVLANWYQEMQPILLHNRKILQNLTHQQILNTEFRYE